MFQWRYYLANKTVKLPREYIIIPERFKRIEKERDDFSTISLNTCEYGHTLSLIK